MVTEKDFVKLPITKDMVERTKGLVLQSSLRARSLYEGKSNEELEEILRFQTWNHRYCSVGGRDDVELYVCEGILVEDRGYSWDDIDRLWYEVVMECRHNGMEYQYGYMGKPGGGPESVDYTKPVVKIITEHTEIRLSGDELAECYLYASMVDQDCSSRYSVGEHH